MSDILQRLQGKTELCKALGLEWDCGNLVIRDYGTTVYLDNDDCPGSALLVSRCLDWLKAEKRRPDLMEEKDGSWKLYTLFGEEFEPVVAPTRVLAALAAVLEVEEGK